jgi:hypothetical protein
MHCTPASSSPSFSSSSTHADLHPPPDSNRDPHARHLFAPRQAAGDTFTIPAWKSCGRIVNKERGDFYEFVACNGAIAVLAVGLVLVRSKQLKARQARQLAARIGLTRRVPGGWVG